MLDKLAEVEKRYEELERLMFDSQLLSQQREYSKLAKERAELEEIVACFREWRKVEQEIQQNRQLLEENDEAIRELAKEEVGVLRQRKEDLENRLKFLILPKDPNDSKNVIIEIRAGTGGDEAALFAGELYRMYTRYAESRGWRTEILSSNPTGLGGFKEIIMMIEGKGAYSSSSRVASIACSEFRSLRFGRSHLRSDPGGVTRSRRGGIAIDPERYTGGCFSLVRPEGRASTRRTRPCA
jgi:peptide chain release factor 1